MRTACLGLRGRLGVVADPYIIQTLTELQNMRWNPAANFTLANDIDASPTVGWGGGAGFVPIGSDFTKFTGSLEGNGHTITD